jgi:acetyltransferase-like isoleucine patch superfamily enzyme
MILLSSIRKKLVSLFDMIWVKADPVGYVRHLGVKIGNDVRLISIKPGMGTFGSEPYLITIGSHVTIAGAVQFVTHDGGVWVFREKEPDINVFGRILVGDNVFIGYGSIIMPDVTIGSNCVVGAGAIVTRDIPENSVAVGVPAKVIMSIDEYYEAVSLKKVNLGDVPEGEKKNYLLSVYKNKNG